MTRTAKGGASSPTLARAIHVHIKRAVVSAAAGTDPQALQRQLEACLSAQLAGQLEDRLPRAIQAQLDSTGQVLVRLPLPWLALSEHIARALDSSPELRHGRKR
jgi:hypothetical protein